MIKPLFNAETGEIIAQVAKGADQERYLLETYEPASAIKAINIAGALENNPALTLESPIDCEKGQWLYRNKVMRDAGSRLAVIPLSEVVKVANNIGTCKICLTAKDTGVLLPSGQDTAIIHQGALKDFTSHLNPQAAIS